MIKTYATIMTLVFVLIATAGAFGQVKSEIELTRAEIQADRQAIVTTALELTEEEAVAFWPLYKAYRKDMIKVGDDLVKQITAYADKYETLTDFEAATLIKEYLDVQKRRLKVLEKHIPKFNMIMPAKTVMRFFQIENKLDTIIMMELTSGIPLAKRAADK
jgi:fructose-specific phosphotransferase system component IIB